MTRLAIFGIVICVAATAVVASASSLGGIGSSRLGSGDTGVAHCDTAVTPSYTTSGGNVTAVTVAGIADPACEGAVISVVVVDAAGASIASGGPQTIVADGDTVDNTVAVAVSPGPTAENAAGIHVSVVGP
jgi:hypothetical protein